MIESNINRIIKDIETLATFTATPGEGVTRPSYSKEDKKAKEYLKNEMEKIGLEIWEDGYGTLFGKKEGNKKNGPSVMIGSHYDSVVNGGAFDGTVGVIAALETMRLLMANDFDNDYPIELIVMNAEEGETFGPGTGVSNTRAMMGTMTQIELETAKNRHGETKLEAMKKYGLEPNLEKAKRDPATIKHFIEVHIEQGDVLYNNKIDIGIVEFLPGIGRYKVKFYGKPGDSAAKMNERKDALIAASQFTLKVNELVNSFDIGITGGVHELNIYPNSHQFVPEFVEAVIELRTFRTDSLEGIDFEHELKKILSNIKEETGIDIEFIDMRRIGYDNPTLPSVMDKENVRLVQNICDKLGVSHMILNHGTGHDAMIMAEFVSTNLLYIPCVGGISHSPDEKAEYEDIKKAADVLLHLTMELSKDNE